MSTLSGPRRPPASGETRSLVVFLHGYGADGNDLIGLAEPMAGYLPDTAFRSPDAPERCRVNPLGRQWFPIPWLDGAAEAEMRQAFRRSAALVEAWLDEAIDEEGVTAAETAVVGFSQGTMMALAAVPRREAGVAGIVGFSGRLADPGALAAARSKPPVLLIHGELDEMIPVAALAEAETALSAAGFAVQSHVSAGTGHAIAPDGLGLAVAFLRQRLGAGSAG